MSDQRNAKTRVALRWAAGALRGTDFSRGRAVVELWYQVLQRTEDQLPELQDAPLSAAQAGKTARRRPMAAKASGPSFDKTAAPIPFLRP